MYPTPAGENKTMPFFLNVKKKKEINIINHGISKKVNL
jgi:hypothetical protein